MLTYAFSRPVHWTSIHDSLLFLSLSLIDSLLSPSLYLLFHHFLRISFFFSVFFLFVSRVKRNFSVKVKFCFEKNKFVHSFLLFHFWFLFPFHFRCVCDAYGKRKVRRCWKRKKRDKSYEWCCNKRASYNSRCGGEMVSHRLPILEKKNEESEKREMEVNEGQWKKKRVSLKKVKIAIFVLLDSETFDCCNFDYFWWIFSCSKVFLRL